MIRFRRLFELTSDVDRRRFAEASDLFRAAFPHEADAIDRIAHMLLNRRTIGFDPILLLSTDARDRITGLAFVYYFSDLHYGYLQYFASRPAQAGARHRHRALRGAARTARGPRRTRAVSRRAARRARKAEGPLAPRRQPQAHALLRPLRRAEGYRHAVGRRGQPAQRRLPDDAALRPAWPQTAASAARCTRRRTQHPGRPVCLRARRPFRHAHCPLVHRQPGQAGSARPAAGARRADARQISLADQDGRLRAPHDPPPAREGLRRAPGARRPPSSRASRGCRSSACRRATSARTT